MQEQTKSVSAVFSYHPKELVFIGFATVVVTLLWVSAFGKILNPQKAEIFAENIVTTTLLSQARQDLLQISQSGKTTVRFATSTALYQIQALEQSLNLSLTGKWSNSFSRVEIGGKQLLSADLISAGKVAFVAIGIEESPKTAVLSAATTSSSQAFVFSNVSGFFDFVDNMTFGIMSAVAPELVGD